MEIHPPHGSLSSWRDVLKQLAIITAGVLIALALDGLVSWIDHRLLVREAVANLTTEIEGNNRELDRMFAAMDKERLALEHADEIAGLLLAQKPLGRASIELEAHGAELKNAAVTTGQITGAFGYMDYGAVRRYADVYDLQAQFMRTQEREGEHFEKILAFAGRVGAPEPPPADVVLQGRGEIDAALAGIVVRTALAHQLQQRYAELLHER